MFKQSIAIQDRLFATYGLEVVNVNHPNERKKNTRTSKMNHFFVLRPQYGRDLVLFKKAPQQGAQIILMTAVGPSIGLITP